MKIAASYRRLFLPILLSGKVGRWLCHMVQLTDDFLLGRKKLQPEAWCCLTAKERSA
jgi:hypothetical protein